MTERFDIIFIGAGISTAYTLMHLIEKLDTFRDRGGALRILVIEKADEVWTGVPYGARSGKSALIITPLKEFLPSGDALAFLSWLEERAGETSYDSHNEDENLLKNWFDKNAAALKKGDLEDLYIPRYWFGMFMKERINKLLADASGKGLILCEIVSSEVVDLEFCVSYYKIVALKDEIVSRFVGDKVVLAIGSPPSKPLYSHNRNSNKQPFIINDTYKPGLASVLKSIKNFFSDTGNVPANMLILGSNASALEMIYHLNDDIINRLGKLYVISSSGKFPSRISNIKNEQFDPPALTSLSNEKDIIASRIFDCFIADFNFAETNGIDSECTYQPISSMIIKLISRLNLNEQKKFVSHYGQKIGNYYRRAGSEYLDKMAELHSQNKMELIKGKFLNIEECGFTYVTPVAKMLLNSKIDVVVNCSGSMELTGDLSESCLLENLINRKLCKVNKSGRGFSTNDNFEASKNLYIAGPLLAGNIVGNHRIWHAESCKRIYDLSNDLSSCLL